MKIMNSNSSSILVFNKIHSSSLSSCSSSLSSITHISEDSNKKYPVCSNERYLETFQQSRMTHNEDNSLHSELNPLLNSKSHSLHVFQRIAYGFGHIFNDLCAAMWFSYLLFYLQIILQLESSMAGILLMIGQVADALATPIAGWAVDKFMTRTAWHLTGTLIVVLSFPIVFTRCSICHDNKNLELFYHMFAIILFQIGWAIVQISHLSMIPNLTNNPSIRSELTAIRYTAAVCSSLIAYLVTWLVLRSNDISSAVIGPDDYYKFKDIVIIIIIIGCITSVLFYSGLNWKKYDTRISETKDPSFSTPIRNILLSPLIYQISFLYVASRLYMTLNLVYMPLYLDERVTTNISVSSENLRESLASVPLVSFIASFITSLVLKNRTERWGNKMIYLIGSLISFSSCLCIGFYIAQTTNVFYVYAVAVLIGTGSSVTIISSLCLTAEIIGPNITKGASVYSIVTFTDKLICGIAVVIIEYLKCSNKAECPEYYRYVLAYISGGAALFGFITLISILLPQRRITIPVTVQETHHL